MSGRIESMREMYSTTMLETWSAISKLYKQEELLVTHYCPDRQTPILDVGCGAGREVFGLHDLGYTNITGVDVTPALLDIARQRAAERRLPISFVLANVAESLPFDDQRFGLVTIFENVFGHLTPRSTRVSALKELRRCLKPGGRIIMEITAMHHRWRYAIALTVADLLHSFYNPYRLDRHDKLMRDAKSLKGAPKADLPRSHWFAPKEIDADAQEADLRVILASTTQGVLADPARHWRKVHYGGRLQYVLEKP